MKKLTFISALVLAAASGIAQQPVQPVAANTVTSVVLPYTPTYSATMVPGNSALAVVVLNAWKDYDENTLSRSESIFADNFQMYSSSGRIFKGKEAAMAALQQFRDRFKSASSTVSNWMVLRSPDHPDEQVVCIWGSETDTLSDGTTETFNLHELWSFDKEGKVTQIRSYEQKVSNDGN